MAFIAADDNIKPGSAVTHKTMDSIPLESDSGSFVHVPVILGPQNCTGEAANAREELTVEENDQATVTPRLQTMREFACHLSFFLAGYNGGVTGTLVPTIESVYHLSYSSVSVLFVAYCIGYFASAIGMGRVQKRWGFGRVLVGSGLIMMLGIIINCSQLVSFPLMCFAFFLIGMGYSTQLGMCNSYFATLPRPLVRMGFLHSIYGFGAFSSPIIASIFISRHIRINFFYFTCLGLCMLSVLCFYFTFVYGTARYDRIPEEQVISTGEHGQNHGSIKEVLTSVEVWTLSAFLLFYTGAEESIGGWIVSFMLKVRHGSDGGAAWVASGFYLGIAVGRLALPLLNIVVGERRIVFMYILVACGLQGASWAAKSFAATAIATALVGFVISTFYTAAIHTASMLLPRRMHTSAMTLISSVGQSGSAIFPFVVGVISNKKGIWTMQPSIVALLVGQFICWTLVPKVARRID